MKLSIISFIPSLVKAGFKLWEKSKDWSAKKRIAVMVIAPVSLILMTLVVHFAGPENAHFAAQYIKEILEAFAEHL